MNFKIYNENTIRNLQINNTATELFEEGSLTPPQYEQVKMAFPVALNQPNLFVRLGLFLFTSLCISFSLSSVAFFIGNLDLGEKGWGSLLLLFAVLLTVLNKRFIQERQWYRQGSDNAVCYASITSFVGGICLIGDMGSSWAIALVSFIFLAVGTLRYGDPLLAFCAFYALLFTFFMLMLESQTPLIVLPFLFMVLSISIYYFAKTSLKKDEWFYWEDCFKVLKIASLIVFYGAINYYVVATLLLNESDKGISAPFNILFAFLTAVVPLIYLAIGIQTKDRILWILGSLGIVASILTYRYYFSIMPFEWALILGGSVLLVLSSFLIKYLKTERNGFVYLPKPNKNNLIESLIVNQLLQQAAHSSTPESNVKYGGGDFDGGGAGGDY